MINLFKYCANIKNCERFKGFGYICRSIISNDWQSFLAYVNIVQGPFSVPWPRVIRWRDDLT